MKKLMFLMFILAKLGYSGEVPLNNADNCDLSTRISSLAFVGALGLINADGNISSYNISGGYGQEANSIAAPVASGPKHYLYYIPASFLCVGIYSTLKDFDKSIGLKNIGIKDVFTSGLYLMEYRAISSWNRCPDNISKEIMISEMEFVLTSSILNINF